jgi:CRISPR-associated endonuclease Cas1
MEANLRYYARRLDAELGTTAEYLDVCQQQVATAQSIEQLRLIEARARKAYYSSFAQILTGTEFDFSKRTRRPPRDPGNAMVSFGNTVLYNVILQAMWRTTLDPKIGVVHATNRRSHSLNLDMADLFKPVIVDRVVFSLVNRREISATEHFETREDGGVLMNTAGKRVFLHALEEKLDDVATSGNKRLSYRRRIAFEVMAFQRYVVSGIAYKPFKYH